MRRLYGFSDSLIEQIVAIAEQHEALKLARFSSRARGNFRANSDIDLAACGLLPRNEKAFLSNLDGLPALLKIDSVVVRNDPDPAFLEGFEESGIVLKERQKSIRRTILSSALEVAGSRRGERPCKEYHGRRMNETFIVNWAKSQYIPIARTT